MVGSFVGVVLLESVTPPLLEPPVSCSSSPGAAAQLLVLPPPLELELPPLELLPPCCWRHGWSCLIAELLELLEPLEPVCPLEEPVFRPTSKSRCCSPRRCCWSSASGCSCLPSCRRRLRSSRWRWNRFPAAQPGGHAAPQSKTRRKATVFDRIDPRRLLEQRRGRPLGAPRDSLCSSMRTPTRTMKSKCDSAKMETAHSKRFRNFDGHER